MPQLPTSRCRHERIFSGGTERGGPVYLASDPAMLTVVGVNSKTTGGGSAHVRLDDGGPQKIRGYTRTF